jgi:glycosyltransferase involved in cell wall biosynthesis
MSHGTHVLSGTRTHVIDILLLNRINPEDKEQMELAIVSTFYCSPGGISTFVRNVQNLSLQEGIHSVVLSPDVSREKYGDAICVKAQSRLGIIFRTAFALWRLSPDAVQCHGAWYLLFACLAYRTYGSVLGRSARLVVVKHSDFQMRLRSIKWRFVRWMDHRADAIIFVSEYLREKYARELGLLSPGRTYVVNPGAPEPNSNSSAIKRISDALRAEDRSPIITYVGLFEYPGKVRGVLLLLKAVSLLIEDYPKILLAIAGRGALRSEVDEAVDLLRLENNVVILEDVNNAFDLLSLSDLHCHITFQDNFPIVVLEALAAGVPVIASAVGEVPRLGIQGLRTVENIGESIVEAIMEWLGERPSVDKASLTARFSWVRGVRLLNAITVGRAPG